MGRVWSNITVDQQTVDGPQMRWLPQICKCRRHLHHPVEQWNRGIETTSSVGGPTDPEHGQHEQHGVEQGQNVRGHRPGLDGVLHEQQRRTAARGRSDWRVERGVQAGPRVHDQSLGMGARRQVRRWRLGTACCACRSQWSYKSSSSCNYLIQVKWSKFILI